MFIKIIAWFMSIAAMFASLFGLDFTAPADEAAEIKNVIIMIGDGMGFNHLYSTEEVHGVELEILNRMEYYGSHKTASASSPVTDSAAGGTALATGGRTMNDYIGVYPTDPLAAIAVPASITEVAVKYGKATGIVTSDSIMGATPSAFSAHVRSRDLAEEIFAQQVVSDFDLIWGGSADIVTEKEVNANGKVYVDNLTEVQALEYGQKSIGQFNTSALWRGENEGTDNPTLSQLAVEAINILSQDEDGFFMMLEGAHIDKRSHDCDGEEAMLAVLEFDRAVSAVLDFAEKDGNTLVIVTADHETGFVTKINGKYEWTIGSHSGSDVPCFVYGADSFIADGQVIKNEDVPDLAVAYMTNNEQEFPCPLAYLNK